MAEVQRLKRPGVAVIEGLDEVVVGARIVVCRLQPAPAVRGVLFQPAIGLVSQPWEILHLHGSG
jgi:3-hydroxyisobutyrate dehydrogenase-like beta-hydroxyacid dehydrogenase